MRDGESSSRGYTHDALLFEDDAELLDTVLPFVQDGLEACEAVAVVASRHTLDLLTDALKGTADKILMAESSGWYETPARAIANVHEFRERKLADGAVGIRTLGELDFDGPVEQKLSWLHYEALTNRVFAGTPHWGVCAYDRRRVPEWIVEHAERTHAGLLRPSGRDPSPRYRHPEGIARALAPQPPTIEGDPALELRIDARAELGRARRRVAEMFRASGASQERVMELATGVNEVATNALEHGSPRVWVRCWKLGPDRLVCEVADVGPGLADPLAGYFPPDPRDIGGRGLWLARQTFDTVVFRPNAPVDSPDREGLVVTLATTL